MRQRRLKILNRHGEVRPELAMASPYDDGEEELFEWVSSHISPPPFGQLCEDSECIARQREDDESWFEGVEPPVFTPRPAETYVWRVEGGHVCFTYVCGPCDEAVGEQLEPVEPGEYPTTEGGYAVAPTHCT